MFVSVIIPNYNHAAFLRRRIETVLNQTHQDFEVIIFDDCSTDNSREVINGYRQHPRVSHIVFNEKNSGSTFAQWKKGFALAKGELVWIAESDDYSAPGFLESAVKKHMEHPSAGIVFTNSVVVNEKDEVVPDDHYMEIPARYKADFFNNGLAECREHMVHSNTISNASSAVIKKRVISEIDPDGSMSLAGDWLFYAQILQRSDVYYIAEKLNFYRTHSRTVRSKTNLNKGIYEMLGVLKFFIEQKLVDRKVARQRLSGILNNSTGSFIRALRSRSFNKILTSSRFYVRTLSDAAVMRHKL